MKRRSLILSFHAMLAAVLFMSCSDDNGTSSSPLYDLRTLWKVTEEFARPVAQKAVPAGARANTVAGDFRRDLEPEPVIAGSIWSNNTVVQTLNYVYEYDVTAHLYWSSSTCTDGDGNLRYTALATLSARGFPFRDKFYDGQGVFFRAYDYTYDENLYLITSQIRYALGEDPTDNPDALKSYERHYSWNADGHSTYRSRVYYDSVGRVSREYKVRVTAVKNSLRGVSGFGYYQYYRTYDEGLLTYESKCTFDGDGYPETYSVDENGDGTYDYTEHTVITKTPEGYLESVVWVNDETKETSEKESFIYDEEGLLKQYRYYVAEDGEFVLSSIHTYVWYKNPVNGPTGGMRAYFESDEAGNPVGEYETIHWTVDRKVINAYSAPGEASERATSALEKIWLR